MLPLASIQIFILNAILCIVWDSKDFFGVTRLSSNTIVCQM